MPFLEGVSTAVARLQERKPLGTGPQPAIGFEGRVSVPG